MNSKPILSVRRLAAVALMAGWTLFLLANSIAAGEPVVLRSARSGAWSDAATWEGGKVPAAGSRVLIRTEHKVTYDVKSDAVIRAINIAGTLSFSTNRDTRLDVGLILIQATEKYSESGFDCDAHLETLPPGKERPALVVGTQTSPIPAKHTALIRLHYIEGMDRESCPAIVCCGGRMDLQGATLKNTWVRLGATVKTGGKDVTVAEAVPGWKVGDRIIITATKHEYGDHDSFTEPRTITAIDGLKLSLDRPLEYDHLGEGDYRAEVANLSRNVIVESASPDGMRGHTMYHNGSQGSIGYAEFRHLGKKNVLGRYAIHYHLCGESMRGSSLIGASIWDSHNRWVTIHGTNYLVVRDCVGYRSIGHGFFMEDGTEVFNVLDHNLAVGARQGKPLPKQVLPFDQNEGAGFWWTNSLNTFTRNVAADNDRYGFRYEATPTSRLKLLFQVMQANGKFQTVDVRTLPFVRFEDNEVHSNVGPYGVNLGEGVNRVGPDTKHPFIVRNLKIWDVHYAFRPQVPSLLVENLTIHKAVYGVYHPNFDNHVYRNVTISQTNAEPFNRGHDDLSVQYGVLAVDGLTFDNVRSGGMPLIQISDDNPTGIAETHIRNLKVVNWKDGSKAKAIVNLGGGPRPMPKTSKGVPIFVHDWFGTGRHAEVTSTRSPEFKSRPDQFRSEGNLTGNESRVAEVTKVAFPELLTPVDDLPPATVITHVEKAGGKLLVRGTASDNGDIRKVTVNGAAVRSVRPNFAEWEVELALPGDGRIQAHAEDAAGNVEPRPHVRHVR